MFSLYILLVDQTINEPSDNSLTTAVNCAVANGNKIIQMENKFIIINI